MSARDRILGKLSQKLGPADAGTRRHWAEERVAAKKQTAPIPSFAALDGDARIERFCDEARKVHAEVERLSDISELPERLAAAMRARNQPLEVRMGEDPLFQDLDFGVIETSVGTGRLEEPATLSRATSAAAETGTLCLTSGRDNPATLTFLGDTHYVVIYASQIQAGLEGVWVALREMGIDPRTVNFVTGPSRTADINQTLELGAHGPIALHIFVIDDL